MCVCVVVMAGGGGGVCVGRGGDSLLSSAANWGAITAVQITADLCVRMHTSPEHSLLSFGPIFYPVCVCVCFWEEVKQAKRK